MIKNTILITLLIILSLPLVAQIVVYNSKPIIKEQNIHKRMGYTTDIMGDKYLSGIVWYDTSGNNIQDLKFNRSGDTIEEINTTFIGDSVEITVYITDSLVDTLITIKDSLGRVYYERMYWDDEKETDTTYYYYLGSSDTLICTYEIYSFAECFDSVFYNKNGISRIVSYDLDYGEDMIKKYFYEDGLLVESSSYYVDEELPMARTSYFYDIENKLTRQVHEIDDANYKSDTEYVYHKNGKVKESMNIIHKHSKFSISYKRTYNENGLLISKISSEEDGTTEEIQYTYIKRK